MANIVLKFNDNKKKETAPMEVYRDISIVGVGVPAVPQPVAADYMVFLQAENVPASDIQAITTEVSESSDPYYLIALALNIDYEQAVRRYNKWKNSAKYNVGKLVNVKAVQNSLHQIFTWIPGERILNPEFGSKIRTYLYEGITEQNIEAITAEIHHCVSEWEPRVIIDRIVNVQNIDDTENNTVSLDIYYHIKGLNDQQFLYSYNYYKHPE